MGDGMGRGQEAPVAFPHSDHVDEAAEMRSSENGLPGKSRSFVRNGESFDLELCVSTFLTMFPGRNEKDI